MLSNNSKEGGLGGSAIYISQLEHELRRMLLMEDAEMDRVKLSEQVRGEIFRALSAYTESSLEFGAKALQMLQSLRTPMQHESNPDEQEKP